MEHQGDPSPSHQQTVPAPAPRNETDSQSNIDTPSRAAQRSNPTAPPPSSSSVPPESSARVTRTQRKQQSPNDQRATASSLTPPLPAPRRSARLSTARVSSQSDNTPSASGSSSTTQAKGKRKAESPPSPAAQRTRTAATSPLAETATPASTDRKGKKRAARDPTPPPADNAPGPSTKRAKTTATRTAGEPSTSKPKPKSKRATKSMPKKPTPQTKKSGSATERSKKGDTSARGLIDDSESGWDQATGSHRQGGLLDDSRYDEDEDMEDSDHDDDDEDEEDDGMGVGGLGGLGGRGDAYDRLARLAEGALFDEATAAALFGGEFRGLGGLGGFMSGLSNRFKRLKACLRSPKPSVRLHGLRECSELLLVSNEDTLGAAFSINAFATEFIAILNGKPNIDSGSDGEDGGKNEPPAEMDEDAQLAAALAMSTGGFMPGEDQDEMEAQLLACRCLAHLMEALPGSGHTLVHLGAVPALCSKLKEISYIELAEQTLSTMEKISAEYPGAIVREGGLAALLNFLPFFSTNVQRTAVTAAANCCRNISSEYYEMVREAFPTLREVLTQSDQRLVEQATLAVVRTLEAYRGNAEHLEGLLDLPTVTAINALLTPSGGSPIISDSTYTHLLKALSSAARASAKVAIAFLEAGMTSTVHYILTGVLPLSHEDREQGDAPGGQSLGGGIADMAIMQNLAHRPKDQVEEALGLVSELLPPTPRDGIFDPRSYTEKSLAKIKKRGGRPERSRQRSSRAGDASGSSSASRTPTDTPVQQEVQLAGLPSYSMKAKRDAEAQYEQRLALLKENPNLVSKFMRALLPVLVDVYAASVSSRVRTKALTGILKAAAFAEPEDLHLTLTSVPMSSFLGSIISAKDSPTFVLNALQLVEVLANKLPDVYLTSFQREGVVFEIETLSHEELSSEKAAKAKQEEEKAKKAKGEEKGEEQSAESASDENEAPRLEDALLARATSALTDSRPSDHPTLFGMTLADSPLGIGRRSSTADMSDANIVRARIIGAKNIFVINGEQQNEAALVLEKLAELVRRLCVPEASEGELRDTLREIAAQFSNVGQSLSSFELLKSGLVDGLLAYVDIDGAVSSADRRVILHDIFSDTALASPSPLTMLVKRLHESLGRLETFEVETAFNNGSSSASSLARTMRIRLQAENSEDVPKQMSSLSVTIQAIAPVQALHDYLRPRINDPGHLSGASTLQSMFAAYANSRGVSGGSSTSRLLAALAAGAGGMPMPGESSSAPESSAPPMPSDSGAATAGSGESPEKKSDKPQRRRSARLSGRGMEGTAEAGSSSAAGALSSSAPPPGLLPQMPMDLDFDDDFSEDDYDAEVFEEDMEEELAQRPTEKVVNMAMADDGSRLEAKTPDGTRIATPNQAAAEAAAPATSSTPTRTGSYAGAVKTAPVDWHLEFSIDGETLAPTDTIYGAVHRHAKNAGTPTNAFALPVTFKFRKVDGPQPQSKDEAEAASPATTASMIPEVFEPASPVSKILRLLRVVHNLCVDGYDAVGRADALDESIFVNNKLTAKLTRQLEETMILASGCLPEWSVELPKHFAFLFPFEARYAFLRSTSFGYSRLIAHWQASQPRNSNNNRRDDNLSHLARLVRQKVRISRPQLLESCVKVLELYGTSNGILEVEYFEEIGTGLGPTLEFYAMASKEFARRSLKLWRDEDESKEGPYVWHAHGLFPAPLKPEERNKDDTRLSYFKTLGLFVGRALLDSRIIDLNFNRVFLKLMLNKPVKRTIATLKQVDAPLARSLERLQAYLLARKEIEALASLPPSSRRSKLATLTIGGAKLADLSLDFTLPGYDIELKPGGRSIDVDDANLEEYIDLVLEMTLGSGVTRQVEEFQHGFSMIFAISDLRIFSPDELGLLCGNADEDWSRETIEQSMKADHGYNQDSRVVRDLIEIMSGYATEERRAFLQFITGAPKLPLGGFKGLNPPFTVVRKPHEAPFKADDYLPSVMTCATYLKLPDYSSRAVLASQLQRSMRDGQGSFNLS